MAASRKPHRRGSASKPCGIVTTVMDRTRSRWNEARAFGEGRAGSFRVGHGVSARARARNVPRRARLPRAREPRRASCSSRTARERVANCRFEPRAGVGRVFARGTRRRCIASIHVGKARVGRRAARPSLDVAYARPVDVRHRLSTTTVLRARCRRSAGGQGPGRRAEARPASASRRSPPREALGERTARGLAAGTSRPRGNRRKRPHRARGADRTAVS